MNLAALLVVGSMVVMRTARCSPVCREGCTFQPQTHHQQLFQHLSAELANSSSAPWHYEADKDSARRPRTISNAVCGTCRNTTMTAKSIYVRVFVHEMTHSCNGWCLCPYQLAVGCACV